MQTFIKTDSFQTGTVLIQIEWNLIQVNGQVGNWL